MKTGERDASVDRQLPGVLKARMAEQGGRECLDAETLAAWADAALDGREREDAEAHAANCARCQTLLAAMVRTLPAPGDAIASSVKTRALWWMAAFVPIAAAVLVWFAVPNRAPVQQSQSVDAIAEPAAPAAEPSPRAAVRAPAPVAAEDEARTQAAAKDTAPPPSASAKELDAATADRPLRDQKTLAAPAEANSVAEDRAAAGTSAAAPASASAAPATPASANLRRETFSASTSQPAFASPDAVIVSSNPSTRFRLLTGGGVQRSADGGATWRIEVTGATETLIGGASPSPSVCWLIGRSGIVLLSIDGRTWRRVASPAAVDLRAITATDHENATVTTADGRSFVTTDGGQTWTRSPDF
jgi:Photosynthesis system II assembly factor YCF48